MNTRIKHFALLLLGIGLISLCSTGCQTTEGFGRDVEDLGEKIQGE